MFGDGPPIPATTGAKQRAQTVPPEDSGEVGKKTIHLKGLNWRKQQKAKGIDEGQETDHGPGKHSSEDKSDYGVHHGSEVRHRPIAETIGLIHQDFTQSLQAHRRKQYFNERASPRTTLKVTVLDSPPRHSDARPGDVQLALSRYSVFDDC